MPELTTFVKDPDATLDYGWDWSAWLDTGETIASYAVTVPDGVTLGATTEAAGVVVAWISGGTTGTTYPITCEVTTTAGRIDHRTNRIIVTER